jgi:hypothetical protein
MQNDCNTYTLFCVDYKKCKTMTEKGAGSVDGREVFDFFPSGGLYGRGNAKSTLYTQCGGTVKEACTALIEYYGWTIPDDYPL